MGFEYLDDIRYTDETPQSEPILGSNQVENSAGGYVFAVDDWTRLHRFLILGAEGGTYYIEERKLALENANAVMRCIKNDGLRVVKLTREISLAGRAPKNDPALFVLAMAASYGDQETKNAALAALSDVARIGTDLFHFATYVQNMRGWGRSLRRAVAKWYTDKPIDNLAYLLTKYRQRDGWIHNDLLNLSHAHPPNEQYDALFRWARYYNEEFDPEKHFAERLVPRGRHAKDPNMTWEEYFLRHPEEVKIYKAIPTEALPRIVQGYELAKNGKVLNKAKHITDYQLTWEMVPTSWLNEAEVWEALLPHMPLKALIRNLGKMTSIGLLKPMSDASKLVVSKLSDIDLLRRQRLHPLSVLIALVTYKQGHGVKGDLSWEPVGTIVDVLDQAFYSTFSNVTPTGKRWGLFLDVSGSMEATSIAGTSLSAREASAAMCLITARVERDYIIAGFTCNRSWWPFKSDIACDDGLTVLPITPKQRLDDVVETISNLPWGGTDCSLPVTWALSNNIPIDVFVVYTDSETWAGRIHPVQALRKYRDKMGINAKLIVVGMCSNGFSIADPNDPGMLDVVGFDASAPEIMSMFVRGEI